MEKLLHISGVIVAFLVSFASIIIGAFNLAEGNPSWKFIFFGLMLSTCAVIALLDGAQAMPSIGWFKAKAKFHGLSDLGFILIFIILLFTSVILFSQ